MENRKVAGRIFLAIYEPEKEYNPFNCFEMEVFTNQAKKPAWFRTIVSLIWTSMKLHTDQPGMAGTTIKIEFRE